MIKKVKIGVDVDGVLRDMTSVLMDIFKNLHPKSVKSDIIDGWDFPNIDLPKQKKLDIMFKEYPKELFQTSPQIKNAHKEYLKLNKWAQANNAKLVCATAQMPNLIHHTLIWLGENKFNFDEIYVSDNKHELDIDFLIDDSPQNFDKWVEAGKDPKHFILVDRDWNQHIKVSNRVTSLGDTIKVIEMLLMGKRLKNKVLHK